MVDSIPPSYVGGNIDDWRIGKGATMYYPVAVPGALLSAGTPTPRRETPSCAERPSSAR
jgi:acetamidase/formamidase